MPSLLLRVLLGAVFCAGILAPGRASAEITTMFAYCSVRDAAANTSFRSPVFEVPISAYDAPYYRWTYGSYSKAFRRAVEAAHSIGKDAADGCYAYNRYTEHSLAALEARTTPGYDTGHMKVAGGRSDEGRHPLRPDTAARASTVDVAWAPDDRTIDAARAAQERETAERERQSKQYDGQMVCRVSFGLDGADRTFVSGPVARPRALANGGWDELAAYVYDQLKARVLEQYPDVAGLKERAAAYDRKYYCDAAPTRREARRKQLELLTEAAKYPEDRATAVDLKLSLEQYSRLMGLQAAPEFADEPKAVAKKDAGKPIEKAKAAEPGEAEVAAEKERQAAAELKAEMARLADEEKRRKAEEVAAREAEEKAKVTALNEKIKADQRARDAAAAKILADFDKRQKEYLEKVAAVAEQNAKAQAEHAAAVAACSAGDFSKCGGPPTAVAKGSTRQCKMVTKSGVAASTFRFTRAEAESGVRRDMELKCPGGAYKAEALQCAEEDMGAIVDIDKNGKTRTVGRDKAWLCKANYQCTTATQVCEFQPAGGSRQ